MTWWKKLLGMGDDYERVDYYDEGLALMKEGRHHDALTSFRLALRESPGDPIVLQQIAIAYTRIGLTEEATKTYRHVLQKDPRAAGAHYGLAYLLLHQGAAGEAAEHLRAFLANPPEGPDAGEHIAHARTTLAEIGEDVGSLPSDDGR